MSKFPTILPPNLTCALCKQRMQDGDTIRITETGVVGAVGGLGFYRDTLLFRETVTVVEHVSPCPLRTHTNA